MTTTEEIVVSGEDFIERRIFLSPEGQDITKMQQVAYDHGYNRGWLSGFFMAAVVFAFAALCVWLSTR